MKKIFLLLIILFVVTGCGSSSEYKYEKTTNIKDEIIGVWDYVHTDNGVTYISEHFFTINNKCSISASTISQYGENHLGDAPCTYRISGTSVYIDDDDFVLTYDEDDDVLIGSNGVTYTKVSDDPCVSKYGPC